MKIRLTTQNIIAITTCVGSVATSIAGIPSPRPWISMIAIVSTGLSGALIKLEAQWNGVDRRSLRSEDK